MRKQNNILQVVASPYGSDSQTFSDRAPLVGPVLSSPRTTWFQDNSIYHCLVKGLEKQNWHKCNMNKMAVWNY